MLSRPQATFVERNHCINCGSTKINELSHGSYRDEPLAGFINADPWGENPMPYLETATWSLVRCEECSQVFHRRVLSDEWNERRFAQWMNPDAIAIFLSRYGTPFELKFEAGVHNTAHAVRIENMTKDIRPNGEPVRLLDFGCGFGTFIECCATFGFECTGIDRSVGRRSEARIEILPSLDELKDSKPYHAITLFEVLEHLDSPSEILASLTNYIMPGGLLVLQTPDCSGVTDIKSHQDYSFVHPLDHINAFTHDTLKSIVERHGFRHVDRSPVILATGPLSAVKKAAKFALKQDGKSTQICFRKL